MATLRRDLLRWFDARGRDLPWRGTGDPYAVWVSEVMLQQTRVATVVPYYEAWMRRFPTVADLAAASLDEVMAAWSGLGYYTRARHMHAAARTVVAEHDGVFPTTAAGLRALPGVGEYTAAAVASIACGERVAAVDGNAERVVSRLRAIGEDATHGAGRRAVAEAAAALVDPVRPGDWNQAVMELGATVCAPLPRCPECPVAAQCAARAQGVQADLPVRRPRAAPRVEAVHFGMVMGDGRLLLVRRPDDGLLGGTWALPGGDAATPLSEHVRKQAALQVQISDSSAALRHEFTHRVWEMRVHTCHVLDVEAREPALPVRWIPLNRLEGAGLATAMKKAIAAAGLPVP